MPSTANPVVTVGETLMLRSGKRPVSINHTPSKSIPRFLPAKLLVNAIATTPSLFRICREDRVATAPGSVLVDPLLSYQSAGPSLTVGLLPRRWQQSAVRNPQSGDWNINHHIRRFDLVFADEFYFLDLFDSAVGIVR